MFGCKKTSVAIMAYFPALWVGSIPLGPSIESIFFVLALLSIIIQPDFFISLKRNAKTSWFYASCLIFLFTILSTIWSPAVDIDTWYSIKKVSRWLLLPVMMIGFKREKDRQLALNLFIVSMILTVILSFLKYQHILNWGEDDSGHVFYNHIMTGFLVVFAAFLCLEYWVEKKNHYYLVAYLLFSTQILVMNTGKMAYGLYALLMVYWIWSRTAKSIRLVAIVVGFILILSAFYFSPVSKNAMIALIHDWSSFQQGNGSTTLGFRMQFHDFAFELFKQHSLFGNGAGSYAYWFKGLNPVPEWPFGPDTHSQYWLIASETGLIGIGLWMFFMSKLWQSSLSSGWYGQLFRGLLLIVLLNSLTDNVLDRSIGYLFVGLAAIAFSKRDTRHPKPIEEWGQPVRRNSLERA